ncbi:MAG: non-canonical purine NTP pyrophosphatase [Ignavibacteriales bacterium]|nr:MAG: hypothetical protein F9K26_03240 [Ignavibacteriaceae bacterium]MBW7872449.1 non-canonical purine NTP pyrophosphatase [Ignavibacteria bacterium]MCZ2141998.1 non-canonical purine NTP pyrophosphatase [Ignavibacteriales bacterium]OQY70673.1 MAG: hypothetical protein B6D45_10835 [Ignavibacteriales bacterium UTCHB3]MBV6445164.1 dITP/XTP pyrophosphatase [Ignavibacteriaceae bacterium]
MPLRKKILAATHNRGKLTEIRELLGNEKFEIIPLDLINSFPEIPETGETFEENAVIKAVESFKLTGIPALADDSGLIVDCLDGRPGVYSARYANMNFENRENNQGTSSDGDHLNRSAVESSDEEAHVQKNSFSEDMPGEAVGDNSCAATDFQTKSTSKNFQSEAVGDNSCAAADFHTKSTSENLQGEAAGEISTAEKNLQKVVREISKFQPPYTARYVCVMAYYDGNQTIVTTGECEGELITEKRGTGGFGYDPIFIPSGFTETMAQLPPEVKNSLSHRFKAITKMKEEIER